MSLFQLTKGFEFESKLCKYNNLKTRVTEVYRLKNHTQLERINLHTHTKNNLKFRPQKYESKPYTKVETHTNNVS